MRAEKQFLLDEIREKINGSSALVVLSYKNLDPNRTSSLRSGIRKAGGSVMMVRKRVFLKAAQQEGITLVADALDGHIAVCFSDQDPIETTKAIFTFADANEDAIAVHGGFFDGQVVGAQDVKEISKLPGRDQMRSLIIGVLEAPMSQLLATFNAILTSVPHCIENKNQKTES